MLKLKKVQPPHKNLWTIDESVYTDRYVRFVAAQGIDGVGRISAHDHGEEGLTELIFRMPDAVYGGLERQGVLIEGYSAAVPVGVRHGDPKKASRGQWLSVKVDSGAKYDPHPFVRNNNTVAHTFWINRHDRLVVAYSDNFDSVMSLMDELGKEKTRSIKLFGLPLIKTFKTGQLYEPSIIAERYLGIELLQMR